MAKKNHMKSVRLSDEVLGYVEGFEGEGFNQKFENLVLFCMAREDALRQRINYLDEELRRRRNILRLDESLNYLQHDIQRLHGQLAALSAELDKPLNGQ